MAKVEELVAALHAEGALDTTGGFTLDSARAREKLRQYQLARPHEYVLLLVQAAILRGATKIRFDIDADDVRMNFDGQPFTREDFGDLYSSMFVDRATREVQAKQELALAVNAAMALNPRYIRVFSGDEQTRVFLELRPNKPDKLNDVKPIALGTWIHVKQRFRPGLLVQFLRNLRGTIVEELALRERCRFADVEVVLDGETISHGFALPGLAAETAIASDGVKGTGGLMPPDGDEDPPPASVDILCNGVMITRRELSQLPARFRAVVDGSHLKKDASQFEVVQDDAYEQVIAAVTRCCEAAIVTLLTRHAEAAAAPVWEQELARECLARWGATWAKRDGGLKGQLASEPLLAAVAAIPLWSTTAGARLTTRALIEREGDIEHAAKRFEGFVPDDMGHVLLLPGGLATEVALKLLTSLFGERLKDVTRKLERAYKHEKNRRAWRARPHPPHLGEGSYVATASIVDKGVGGVVGLRAIGSQGCEVRMVKDGCLLYEVSPRFGVPGLVAVLVADFQPNSAYDGAHRNKIMARSLHAFLRAVERMMTSLAQGVLDSGRALDDVNTPTRGLLRNFIVHVVNGGYASDLFEEFGFSKSVTLRHLNAMDRTFVPDWKLSGEAHPLARLPLFRSVGAGYLSLVELAALAAQGEGVSWLEHEPLPGLEGVPPTLLVIAKDEREALTRLLGRKALRDFGAELVRLEARARFFARPESTLTLFSPVLSSVTFEHEGVRGLLGLRTIAVDESSFTVLKHNREIGQHSFKVGLRGIVGIVNDDDAPIDDAWKELKSEGKRLTLEEAVQAGLPSLVASAREFQRTAGRQRPRLTEFMFEVASALYENAATLSVHRDLRRALGEEQGDQEFAEILALLDTCTHGQLTDAFRVVRGAGGGPPRAAAVAKALGEKRKRRADPLATLRKGLLPELREIMKLELARTAAGKPVSMGELLMSEKVYYVLSDSPEIYYDGDERRIVRIGKREAGVLRVLLGKGALVDSMGWLYTWAQRQAFERRPPLEALKIDDDDAIVTIEIDEQGRRGQLGLRRWGIQGGGASTLRVCKDHKVVCALQLELDLPMVGVINFDELEVSDDFASISDRAEAEIMLFCDGKVEALLAELASRWAALNVNGVETASQWVMHALVVRARNAGSNRRKLNTPALKALAAVPAFPGLGGERYSLSDLSELHRARKRVPYYVGSNFPGDAPDFPVVEASPWILDALNALFPKLEDYRETYEREQAVARRKQQARALAAEPPADALFSVKVKDKGLSGHLWVTPSMGPLPQIDLGDDGKVVERRQLSEGYPCHGAIEVPAIRVDKTWESVKLARKQEGALRRGMNRLYRDLVNTYERLVEVEGGGDGTIADRVREAFGAHVTPDQIGRVLRPLTLRLHKSRGNKKSSERTLYRKLRALPLLALGNGRFISLEVALDERPSQLEHLGLWFVAPREWKDKLMSVDDLASKDDEKAAADDDASGNKDKTKGKKKKKKKRRKKKKVEVKERQPTPEPLPPPTAEQRLLDSVRAELRLVRGRDHELLSNAHLDAVDIDTQAGAPLVYEQKARFCINLADPVAARALEEFETDPLLVSVLASAVYTALNLFFEKIEDDHEAAFHALHARHVLSSAAARPRPRVSSGEIG